MFKNDLKIRTFFNVKNLLMTQVWTHVPEIFTGRAQAKDRSHAEISGESKLDDPRSPLSTRWPLLLRGSADSARCFWVGTHLTFRGLDVWNWKKWFKLAKHRQVNGWYSLDRDQLVNNFTYLEEMSEKSCNHLETTMPHYHKVSMQTMLMDSGHINSTSF